MVTEHKEKRNHNNKTIIITPRKATMIRLTYASTALKEWSPEELLKLLKDCRKNNGAKNITGILLYANGSFFQVLEGD